MEITDTDDITAQKNTEGEITEKPEMFVAKNCKQSSPHISLFNVVKLNCCFTCRLFQNFKQIYGIVLKNKQTN